jgi:hypothetical protein
MKTVFALSAATLLASTTAVAQTKPAAPPAMAFPTIAKKVEGVRYFTIETITAKPGAGLWKIISEHFTPAARAAGVPVPVVYHTETGPAQTIVITPLTGGLADMEYEFAPDDVKFMAALARQEGGQDKAMALIQQYQDGIATRSREIVHEHIAK